MGRRKIYKEHGKPQRNSPVPIKPKFQNPTYEPLYHLGLPQNPADEPQRLLPSLDSSTIPSIGQSLLQDSCVTFESQAVFPSQSEPSQLVFSSENESTRPVVMQRGLLAWEGNSSNSGVLLQEGVIIFKPQNIQPQQERLTSLESIQLPEVTPLQSHDNLQNVEPTPFGGQHDVKDLKLPELDQMIPEFILPCQDDLEDAASISELKSSPNEENKEVVQTLGEREMGTSSQQFDRRFSKLLVEGERQGVLDENCNNKLSDAISVTGVQIKQEKYEVLEVDRPNDFSNPLVGVKIHDENGNVSSGVQINQETDYQGLEDRLNSSEEESSILPDCPDETESTTQKSTKEDRMSRKKVQANGRVKSTEDDFWRLLYRQGRKPVPSNEARLSNRENQHWPQASTWRRCVVCSRAKIRKRVRIECAKCDVGLCAEICFKKYHTLDNY